MDLLLFFLDSKKEEAAPPAGEFPHVPTALTTTTSNTNRDTINVMTKIYFQNLFIFKKVTHLEY